MPKRPATQTNNIRAWRLYRKMPCQKDLAEATRRVDPSHKGLDRVTICRLESGAMRFHETHLAMLAAALSCEPWQLLCNQPPGRYVMVRATILDDFRPLMAGPRRVAV